ncbi:MAG: hypothetical protein ACTSVB_11375 [Candidatus Heimdallarchaeaceae archaeon]
MTNLLENWGIPKRFIISLSSLNLNSVRVTEYLKNYCELFPNVKGLFIFEKDTLENISFKIACSIITTLVYKKKIKRKAYILQVPTLMMLSNLSFEESSEDYTSMLSNVKIADILLINDLGSQILTNSQVKAVYSFIYLCYIECKPLIITTQQPLQETEKNIGKSMSKIIATYCNFMEV